MLSRAFRRQAAVLSLTLSASLLAAPSSGYAAPDPIPGVIQGTITETETGAPLPGACAHFFAIDWIEAAVACADDAGQYATVGLDTTKTYRIKFTANDHADRYFPDRPTIFNIGALAANPAGSIVNASLPKLFGSIRGRITVPEGTGQSMIQINAVLNGTTVGISRTRSDGSYELDGLPPGDYQIWVPSQSCLPGGYIMEGAARKSFTLTAGTVIAVDYQFANRSCTSDTTFDGRVVDAVTGAPIPNADFRIVASTYNFEVATGHSGPDGSYSVAGVGPWPNSAGYRVQVNATGYPTQWANGGVVMSAGGSFTPSSTRIPVSPGFGELRGRIIGPDGVPVQATVSAIGAGNFLGSVTTVSAADGSFSFPQLGAGPWALRFSHPQLGLQWYHQVAYTSTTTSTNVPSVTVTPGNVTTVEEQYADRVHIAVTLLDKASGQPIRNACVQGSAEAGPTVSTCAAADGVYRLDVAPGTVHWRVSTAPDHLLDVASEGPGWYGTAAAGQQLESTVRLRPGGRITLTVARNPDGSIPGVCLRAVQVSWLSEPAPEGIGPGCNLVNGQPVETFTTGVIPVGATQLFVVPQDQTQGVQWLGASGGTGMRQNAAVINVQQGQPVTGPTIKVDRAGYITGTVNSEGMTTGYGRAGVSVRAGGLDSGRDKGCSYEERVADCTDAYGDYRLALGPYAWPLEFYVSDRAQTWSGGAASRLDAQLITVQAGQTTTYAIGLRYAGQFTVTPPSGGSSFALQAYDARTGDPAGTFSSTGSSAPRGPLLLRADYVVNSTFTSCWLWQDPQPWQKPSGIFYAGFDGKSTPITIRPGVNCLSQAPGLLAVLPRR